MNNVSMNNMSMNSTSINLSVVVFKDGDHWIAQGLEYDIATQSKKLGNLPDLFNKTLLNHIFARLENGQEPFKAVPCAPDEYWKMLDEYWKVLNDEMEISLEHDPVPTPPSNFSPPLAHTSCDFPHLIFHHLSRAPHATQE